MSELTAEKAAPEPGETYYKMWGWSGCAGSAWSTLPPATKDGWRHAEDAQGRANALARKIDRCTHHMRMALGYQPGQSDPGLEALVVWAKRVIPPEKP